MSEAFDLTRARINRGLSQRELASELDLHPEVIRRLENGHGVRVSSAKKVADFFDVLVTDIMPVQHAGPAAT
jgi:ribosome-binding protein aMBF1 (putative translation factor)